jgi:hypothetical protein
MLRIPFDSGDQGSDVDSAVPQSPDFGTPIKDKPNGQYGETSPRERERRDEPVPREEIRADTISGGRERVWRTQRNGESRDHAVHAGYASGQAERTREPARPCATYHGETSIPRYRESCSGGSYLVLARSFSRRIAIMSRRETTSHPDAAKTPTARMQPGSELLPNRTNPRARAEATVMIRRILIGGIASVSMQKLYRSISAKPFRFKNIRGSDPDLAALGSPDCCAL